MSCRDLCAAGAQEHTDVGVSDRLMPYSCPEPALVGAYGLASSNHITAVPKAVPTGLDASHGSMFCLLQ
jgi:hypothetical protein